MSQAGLVGPMVAQGPVDRYRPMGVFGRPAFESHVQLRAALLSRLGPRFANYFARPTFDAERRSIRWTAESPGTVIAWSTLDADRRAQLEPTLAQIRSGLQRYVDELKAIAANPARGDAGHALASLIECRLETGRTHQIRVHMSHIGHPLLGDRLYGSGFATKASRLPDTAQKALDALGRQALHAALLGFAHPATGEALHFESEPPADFANLQEALSTL